jgi:hypothetical protein
MSDFKKLLAKLKLNIVGLSDEEKEKNRRLVGEGLLHKEIIKDWQYARNERDEQVMISPLFESYLRVLLDYRINIVICGGCAQIGKSLFAILAYSYTTCKLGYNSLFLFPQQQALERLVPLNHRPIVENWEKLLWIGKKRNQITNLKTIKSLSGAAILYSYVVSKVATNEGAAASTAIVSVSTDVLYIDEVSQYPKGAIEMAYRRLDASRIASQPIRLMGTAGNGAGIEKFINEADYNFYPSVICKHCNSISFLDPFGALLVPTNIIGSNGDVYQTYLSVTGRPLSWYDTKGNSTQDVNKASIVCTHCFSSIVDEDIDNALFRERKSLIELNQFLDTLENKNISLSVELSPLLRGNTKMPKLLREGLTTASPTDWVQQALGKPSCFGLTNITVDHILAGFDKKLPFVKTSAYSGGCDSLIIAGIDQGHSSDHLVIIRYYYDATQLEFNLISENATREFLYFGSIARNEIATVLEAFNVDFGFIDNEPSITSAAELVRETSCLMLADQQGKQKDDFIYGDAHDGGHDFPCIKVNHRKFGRNLIAGFSRKNSDNQPLYQFNKSTEWIIDAHKELSPIRHFTSVTYDPETGMLKRPIDHVDHYFYATLFAEAAFSYAIEYDYTNAGTGVPLQKWI